MSRFDLAGGYVGESASKIGLAPGEGLVDHGDGNETFADGGYVSLRQGFSRFPPIILDSKHTRTHPHITLALAARRGECRYRYGPAKTGVPKPKENSLSFRAIFPDYDSGAGA